MNCEPNRSPTPAAFQRDALATLLAANGYGHIQQLALLGRDEKWSVAALMLIGFAIGAYSRETDGDVCVTEQLCQLMHHLSPTAAHALSSSRLVDAAGDSAELCEHLKQWLAAVTPSVTKSRPREHGAPSREDDSNGAPYR